jgi:SPP1 gp7 family putative phage head morphogenesis protein
MVNDYWKKRIEAEQLARMERDATLSDEMTRLYNYHFKELEKEIRAFSERYASKNNLPLSEVKARVDEMDVKAFEEKAKRYVAEKDFSAKANSELSLYNLKMKMNRLELLQYQLDLEMVALGDAEHKVTERFLNDEYTQALKAQSGLLGRSVLSSSQIEKVAQTTLNTPFKGAKWSNRIWQRQDALRGIVARMTEDYLLKGRNPTTMISKIRKEFGVSASEAKRLAVTEGARVATEAERQSYESNGYEEYEYIAEPKACDICRPLDGKIFKVVDMSPGENAAPMHPHCRCATAAHFSMSEKEYERLIKKSADSLIGETSAEIRSPNFEKYKNLSNEEIKEMQEWSDDVFNKKYKRGTKTPIDGIKNYTQNDYGITNEIASGRTKPRTSFTQEELEALAAKKRIKLRDAKQYFYDEINRHKTGVMMVKTLDESLSQWEIPRDLRAYRKFGFNYPNKEFINLKPGDTLIQDSFMSTTLDLEAIKDNFNRNHQIIYDIEVPKGTNGAYVGTNNSLSYDEKELLLHRGMKMEVLEVTNTEGGKNYAGFNDITTRVKVRIVGREPRKLDFD